MRVFFLNDDFGQNPAAFARLITLFARYDHKLNAAASPADIGEAILRASIPYSYQAAPFLQMVSRGGALREDRDAFLHGAEQGFRSLQENFENYFPCYVSSDAELTSDHVALLKRAGYLMLSRGSDASPLSAPGGGLPEFNVCLDLHAGAMGREYSAREVFEMLRDRYERGEEYSGVRLRHGRMTEEDFATLEELLRNLEKRSIATYFFSDLIPGFERRESPELSHI